MLKNTIFHHPALGNIRGRVEHDHLVQFRGLPYGSIPQRFARSKLVTALPEDEDGASYDATRWPSVSVQPLDSAKTDCKGNQLPEDLVQDYHEEQSEDCLTLSITLPLIRNSSSSPLPVLVFVHGGAFFIGAGTRPYYNPISFCEQALRMQQPHVFVSINYRLGALGFFHSPDANGLMPANNGLHDQLIGFEWISRFIGGFGGDPKNIRATGQSAGGMSLTIHNLSGGDNVWNRSAQFSGSLVTMPVQTPEDHQKNFLSQASKLGIKTKNRNSEAIAQEMIDLPTDKLRSTNYVGLPSSQTELLPYPHASTALMRHRTPTSPNLSTQLISSTTYDGGISYNLLSSGTWRNHAKTFISIAEEILSHPEELLSLYDIHPTDDDPTSLRKICQFETDIGFFAASLAQVQAFPGQTYLLLFDLGNPFEGPLPCKAYATHTWDIVALLGAYEDRLDDEYLAIVREFREKIIRYLVAGEEPWPIWTEEEGLALVVGREGVRVVGREVYMGPATRRGKLLVLAERERGERGCDVLWDEVCRRFLMSGE